MPSGLPAPGRIRAVIAVEGDGGNDGGVGAFEPGLECRLVGCESSEQSQIAAGGAAGREDHGGVGAIVLAVFSYPGKDLFEINQMIWKCGSRPEAVIRADADPTLACEAIDQGAHLAALSPTGLSAAVQIDQRRSVRRPRAWAVKIKKVRAARVAVRDIP